MVSPNDPRHHLRKVFLLYSQGVVQILGGGGGNCLLAQLLLDYLHFLLMTFILSALHCVFVQVQELCQVVDAELGYAEGIKPWNPTSKVIG